MSHLKKKRLFLVGSDYVFPRAANAIIRDQAAELGAELIRHALGEHGQQKMLLDAQSSRRRSCRAPQ